MKGVAPPAFGVEQLRYGRRAAQLLAHGVSLLTLALGGSSAVRQGRASVHQSAQFGLLQCGALNDCDEWAEHWLPASGRLLYIAATFGLWILHGTMCIL